MSRCDSIDSSVSYAAYGAHWKCAELHATRTRSLPLVRLAPLTTGTAITGAVYVYRLKNTWRLANMVKPNYLPNSLLFGYQVALSGNGQTLIVGHQFEGSPAQALAETGPELAHPNQGQSGCTEHPAAPRS